MALEHDVANVLRDPKLGRINFQFDKHLVSPAGLAAVAKSIESSGGIKIDVGSTGPLLSAAYSANGNKITIQNNSVPNQTEGQAAILHESVHALVEMEKWKLSGLEDEAVAYLAEAIFWRIKHSWPAGKAATMAIYNAADVIARARNLNQTQFRDEKLKKTDLDSLKRAIGSNEAYKSLR